MLPGGPPRFNPAGEIIEREADRLGAMVDECVGEIARRDPAPGHERDDALRARVVHELRCNGTIHDPALLRDLAQVWASPVTSRRRRAGDRLPRPCAHPARPPDP